MKCPFPGMDPFLESPAYWPDFHVRFITFCCDAIGEQLPDGYEVRIDERVNLLESTDDASRQIVPDLTISQDIFVESLPRSAGGTATLEPVTIPLVLREEVRETWIRILHRSDQSLVTTLELLSPSNKTGLGRGQYSAKRVELIEQPVNLVEIDLLLGGQRLPMAKPLPRGDYYAFVSRATMRPKSHVYAWRLRDPLPTIPIPLKVPDPDLMLSLADVFATTFERGRYRGSALYRHAPPELLSPDDQNWAAELVRRCST